GDCAFGAGGGPLWAPERQDGELASVRPGWGAGYAPKQLIRPGGGFSTTTPPSRGRTTGCPWYGLRPPGLVIRRRHGSSGERLGEQPVEGSLELRGGVEPLRVQLAHHRPPLVGLLDRHVGQVFGIAVAVAHEVTPELPS